MDDTALIHASMEYLYNEKFQCKSKEQKLYERYASDPQASRKVGHIIRAHQEASFCNKKSPTPIHYVDRYGFNSCLCNFQHPLIHYFITITDNFNRSVMPHEGCLSDQSAYVLDVIYLIQNLKDKYLEEMKKESSKKG
jgi:hypothetical protein